MRPKSKYDLKSTPKIKVLWKPPTTNPPIHLQLITYPPTHQPPAYIRIEDQILNIFCIL